MKFTEIDITKWSRGQVFYYFSKVAPTSYSLTVDVDVTKLLNSLKEKNRKFFPTYLWLVTKCLNKQMEFKIAYKDNQLGYYDSLAPLYASFHDDDKTFSLMWTAYNSDYELFYKQYMENKRLFSNNHGVLSQPDTPPPINAYTVSTLPWISFKHFAVHSHDNKQYFFPSIESGKIYQQDGKQLMPLSLTCHHATTDGYHVNKFLEDLNEEISEFIKSN